MASDDFKGPFTVKEPGVRAEEWEHDVVVDANGVRLDCDDVVRLLNRAPTGLTAWVPPGYRLCELTRHALTGQYTAHLASDLLPAGEFISGTGSTPELAVQDAAKKVKP